MKEEAAMTKISTILTILLVSVACLWAQEVELTGEVINVDEVTYEDGDVYVLQAQIRTRTQEMVMVELGPSWALESDIEPGDEITVRGKYLEANRVRVREMVCNTVSCALRDDDYAPLWLRTRLRVENHLYNPQTETTVKGKVSDLYIVDDDASSTMEAMVKAQNGELVRVRLAPEWYLRSRLRVGDEIELRGSEVDDNLGRMTIMAREMRNLRTNLEIALRNAQGFPDWRGKVEGMHKEHGRPCYQDEQVGRGQGRQ
jgi:translation initiation factor IF-1